MQYQAVTKFSTLDATKRQAKYATKCGAKQSAEREAFVSTIVSSIAIFAAERETKQSAIESAIDTTKWKFQVENRQVNRSAFQVGTQADV